MLNRTLTFDSSNRWEAESFRYLVTQSIGSAINLVVFSGIVMVFGARTLLVPLAVGAVAGLASNFLMSRYVVLSERPKMRRTMGLKDHDRHANRGSGPLL